MGQALDTKPPTTEVYRDLHQKLVTAGFPPGAKLKPSELSTEYGCSANTVRDVLMRLLTTGLVTFEDQRGFRVAPSSADIHDDIVRFRILLEQQGVAMSMEKGGVAWEAQLSAAHHKLTHIEATIERAGLSAEHMQLWSDAEREFHHTLIAACSSPVLIETYRNIYDQSRQQLLARHSDFGPRYFNAIIAEHRAILDAALTRDEDACAAAIFDHLKRNLK